MAFVLRGPARQRFSDDLMNHRNGCSENDSDYAREHLGVSLNTYKKCVEVALAKTLSLKRHTFVAIFNGARLDPATYGLNIALPKNDRSFGDYTEDEFAFLPGRYFLHRRSFLTGAKFNRSVVEVHWNPDKGCMSFSEWIRYTSDNGVTQQVEYKGDVYIHADRILMSLVSIDEGEVRMVTLHTPNRRKPGALKMGPIKIHGALLAHGFPKGYFQPVISPVQMESVPPGTSGEIGKLTKTIGTDDADYARIDRDLCHAEENAIVMTSLIARVKAR